MANQLHLSSRHRGVLEALLREHLPDVEAWAYGSRVNGRSHDGSDLDLALRAPGLTKIPAEQLADFKDAVCESTIPFLIEARDWARLPKPFHRRIEQEHVVFSPMETRRDRAPLRELVQLTLSSVDKKRKQHEHDVQLCNYMDVYSNAFIRADIDFLAATATEREIERCGLQIGDVLITKDSEAYDDIGVPALVRENIPNLVCGYHLAILRPLRDSLDSAYLYYALQVPEVQHQFHAFANGVTRFGLRKDDIHRTEIPIHDLPEQRAIAHILGTLDDKIELNRRMNETLESMARALFKSWFVDFEPVRAKKAGRDTGLHKRIDDLFPDGFSQCDIGDVPNGWEVASLSRLIDVNPRRSSLTKDEEAPYVPMAAMPTKNHTPTDVSHRAFGSGTRFVNGDTLLARITPCLENGKTAYVDFLDEGQVGWGSTEYIVLRPKVPIPCEYAYFVARSTAFRDFAIQNMTGTSGRQRVQANALVNFPLVSPPQQLLTEFGKYIGPHLARANSLMSQSRTLAKTRDALLPKLISGEIRLRQAEDAVAAVL